MRYFTAAGMLGLVMMVCAPAEAGEHEDCPPPEGHFLHRCRPVGGWNPGGGLLHWWNPNCFPRWCGPDDYCRKPPPNVCRPYCWTNAPIGGPPPK